MTARSDPAKKAHSNPSLKNEKRGQVHFYRQPSIREVNRTPLSAFCWTPETRAQKNRRVAVSLFFSDIDACASPSSIGAKGVAA